MTNCVDVAIVGSGAAGIAAAVTAARTGRTALLLDRRPAPGGTGGFSGLTTLCGLFDDAGEYLDDGFPREFAGLVAGSAPQRVGKVWVLPYRPEKFRAAAAALFDATPGLSTRWNSPPLDVGVENNRIVHLNGFEVGAVIDCTGTAEVARAVGAECLATDETTQASAVIFPLGRVTREFRSPAEAAQVLMPLARAGFPPLSFQPGLDPGTLTVKFAGPVTLVREAIEFLRTNVAGFENCATPLTEFTATPRASRMIMGRYLLTGADVLAGATFPDAVTRAAWPIEQWGRDGVPRLRYLPPGTCYEIPARSLQAARLENLFMAGKTISADVDGIASARVMGCCLATGAAAGQLAADFHTTRPNPSYDECHPSPLPGLQRA